VRLAVDAVCEPNQSIPVRQHNGFWVGQTACHHGLLWRHAGEGRRPWRCAGDRRRVSQDRVRFSGGWARTGEAVRACAVWCGLAPNCSSLLPRLSCIWARSSRTCS